LVIEISLYYDARSKNIKLEGTAQFEHFGVDRRVILKWIFNTYCQR